LTEARKEAQERSDQFGSAIITGIGPERGFREVLVTRSPTGFYLDLDVSIRGSDSSSLIPPGRYVIRSQDKVRRLMVIQTLTGKPVTTMTTECLENLLEHDAADLGIENEHPTVVHHGQ
jgi:hypothetical protein